MSYFKLLGARRKSGKVPTMQKVRLSTRQKERAAQGICIQCGGSPAAATSYLCQGCQDRDSIEDIRDEIAELRRKLLKP